MSAQFSSPRVLLQPLRTCQYHGLSDYIKYESNGDRRMDAKEAVRLAKRHVLDLFAEEEILDIGLEEVEFNELDDTWSITIGFSRPWDQPRSILGPTLSSQMGIRSRSYKVVLISDSDANVISVKNREVKS